jgi:23S rRNA pseudouridine1911/1915/1917 synthase
MVLGKTERSLTELSEQFFERTVDRRYHALVWGDLREDGTIEGHVGRSRSNRTIQAVYPDGEEGKHAVTHYRVLERLGPVTLVECKLETGRTHQIRVHMQHIGHPLFGDPRYGGNVAVKGSPGGKYNSFLRNCFGILPRQALHAKTLGFTHPKSEKFVSFESDLPTDMAEIISKWKTYLEGIAR